jgi:hypothetical protein
MDLDNTCSSLPNELRKPAKMRTAFILRMQKYPFFAPDLDLDQYKNFVAYVLKARTLESQKQPLLAHGCVTHNNGVTVGSGVFCVIHAGLYNKVQLPL